MERLTMKWFWFCRGRILQDLHRLKQLDEVEITREEKLEAGFKTEEDEEEDEEEEEDSEENDTKAGKESGGSVGKSHSLYHT